MSWKKVVFCVVVVLAAAWAAGAAPMSDPAESGLNGEIKRLPSTCLEVYYNNPDAVDGEYLLSCNGNRLSVYCYDFASKYPKEFLSLQRPAISTALCGYTCLSKGWTAMTTTYTKVRFNPCRLQVNTSDTTFSNSTGSYQDHKALFVGSAFACEGARPDGKAVVDFTGTPLTITSKWGYYGFGPFGNYSGTPAPRVVAYGNGYCGVAAVADENGARTTVLQLAMAK